MQASRAITRLLHGDRSAHSWPEKGLKCEARVHSFVLCVQGGAALKKHAISIFDINLVERVVATSSRCTKVGQNYLAILHR